MSESTRSNLYLGLGCAAFALVTLFIWIPLDTDSGIIEKVRRRYVIGDALAPTVAAGFLLIGGLLLALNERLAKTQPVVSRSSLKFILKVSAILIVSVLLMRWTGPILAELANLFRADPIEYRLLRATAGWKHVGFVIGGGIMIAGLMSLVERRFSGRSVVIAMVAVAAIIAVFDLPFEDLLLPPNGDV